MGYRPWGCESVGHDLGTKQHMCKILVSQVHSQIGYFVKLVAQIVKNLPAMQETQVQSLGQKDPVEKGNGNPLQYACPENSMDRGAWRAIVHGVTERHN